jgi:hypothetical protein
LGKTKNEAACRGYLETKALLRFGDRENEAASRGYAAEGVFSVSFLRFEDYGK